MSDPYFKFGTVNGDVPFLWMGDFATYRPITAREFFYIGAGDNPTDGLIIVDSLTQAQDICVSEERYEQHTGEVPTAEIVSYYNLEAAITEAGIKPHALLLPSTHEAFSAELRTLERRRILSETLGKALAAFGHPRHAEWETLHNNTFGETVDEAAP